MAFALIQFNLDQLIFQAKQGALQQRSRGKRSAFGGKAFVQRSRSRIQSERDASYMWRRLQCYQRSLHIFTARQPTFCGRVLSLGKAWHRAFHPVAFVCIRTMVRCVVQCVSDFHLFHRAPCEAAECILYTLLVPRDR